VLPFFHNVNKKQFILPIFALIRGIFSISLPGFFKKKTVANRFHSFATAPRESTKIGDENMNKKIFSLCMIAFTVLLMAACSNDPTNAYETVNDDIISIETPTENIINTPDENLPQPIMDSPGLREQLRSVAGFTDDEMDMIIAAGTSLEFLLNQMTFNDYWWQVIDGQPIGASGHVIASRYLGGTHSNEFGILVVSVIEAAFADTNSAVAIEEMRELGIIVQQVAFTFQELNAALDVLNAAVDSLRPAGGVGWGLNDMTNSINVWLDPYNDAQKAMFNNVLQDLSVDSSKITFTPSVTPEMHERRAEIISRVTQHTDFQIVAVGEIEISRTSIAFMLENRSTHEFNHSGNWELFYYSNGSWDTVPHLPGTDGGGWTQAMYMLQSGGIEQNHIEWHWRFGELAPGRYMFVRPGWLTFGSDERRETESTYAVVEFHVTSDSPVYLPPQPEYDWMTPHIHFIEHSNVTSTSMTVVVENISAYDINHAARIMMITHEQDAQDSPWYEWGWPEIPILDSSWFSDYRQQQESFVPSGGMLAFTVDWDGLYGPLQSGDYKLVLTLGGHANAPHPTGWANGETVVIPFTVQ